MQGVISEQKLLYDFKFHKMKFDVDTPVLVLSKGKSIFKSDCTIFVRPVESIPKSYSQIRAPEGGIATWREYLLFCRQLDVPITQESADFIQKGIVSMRKSNPKINEESMHMRIEVSRLLAVSYLERKLTVRRWNDAEAVCKHLGVD